MARRVALISDHASPLAAVGGVDSGGQNIYVAQVARHLAAQDHTVDVFTRSDRPGLPDVVAGWGRITMPLPPEPTDYELDAAGLTRAEFVTANCFCRKQVLAELGGFDERFAVAWREDADLFFRLLRSGANVIHIPDAIVAHPVRPAPWGVSIAQQKKVLFDALLFKKHPAMYRTRIRRRPRWDYYGIVASLAACTAALLSGATAVAIAAAGLWCALTGRFCVFRLRHAAKTSRHVAEMIVTSAVIPPLAVFWRLVGACKFRVLFI